MNTPPTCTLLLGYGTRYLLPTVVGEQLQQGAYSVGEVRRGAGGGGGGGATSRCSVRRGQRQRGGRRQLRPDIAQLAVEPVLVRRAPTAGARRRPATVRQRPAGGGSGRAAGGGARRRRDDAPVGAEVGGGTGAGRRQQPRVGDVDHVAVRDRIALHLPRRADIV